MHTIGIKAFLWFRAMLQTAALISFCASIPIKIHYSSENSIIHQVQHNVFTNVATRAIESKGASFEDNTVNRIDSTGTFSATASEAQDLKLLWIILLGLGGMGLIFSGLGLSGKLPNWYSKIKSKETSYKPTPQTSGFNTKYCVRCGELNPEEAKFCTKCGTIFPS